jgi:hypothetical protein
MGPESQPLLCAGLALKATQDQVLCDRGAQAAFRCVRFRPDGGGDCAEQLPHTAQLLRGIWQVRRQTAGVAVDELADPR